MTSRRVVAFAALLAIAGYMLLWFRVKPAVFSRSRSDFATFYRAGRMVLSGEGRLVYDLAAENRYDDALATKSVDAEGNQVSLPFVFAPFSLALYTPLALLPYRQAEALWFAVNAGMLLGLALLLRNRLAWGTKLSSFALIVPVVFLPTVLALLQGQPSILLLLLFAVGYLDLVSGHESRAGCWFALAGLKPQLVLPLLLALLLWRKGQTLLSFVLTSGGLTLLSSMFVGWRATLRYPVALMQYAAMENRLGAEHPASMPNLRGLLYVALHPQVTPSQLQKITLALSLLLLAATALLLRRYRTASPTNFSLLVAITLLTSYHAYLHDDSLLLLPLLLTGNVALSTCVRAHAWKLRVILAAIVLLPWAPVSLTATACLTFLAIASLAILVALPMSAEPHEPEPDFRPAPRLSL